MTLIDRPTRRFEGLERRQLGPALVLVVLMVLAAVNFAWQLGSSSYYVDEILSINTSLTPLSALLGVAKSLQSSPPGFYLFQHEWLYHTNDHAEWVARLPSLICGVLLVAAIYWLAKLLSQSSTVGLGAAALAAMSPFLLQFSQLAQNYAFVSLTATVAVAAALRAERSRNHRTAWLSSSLLAAAAALCLHYTAALIVAPLCIRVAFHTWFPLREKVTYAGACAAVQIGLLPFLISQHSAYGARSGVAGVADLSLTSASRVIAGPLAGRVDPLRTVAVAVVLISVLVLLVRIVRSQTVFGCGGGGFVVGVAVGEPLVLLVLSGFGERLALGRYAAVAVPMLIVTIAMAAALMPKPAALLVVLAALVVSALGLIDSHRASGFYADARGVIRYLDSMRHGDDAVLTPDSHGVMLPLRFYADRRPAPRPSFAVLGSAQAATFVAHHQRLWIVLDLAGLPVSANALFHYEQRLARGIGYRSLQPRIFRAIDPLAVTEWVPRSPASTR